jgi:hypothetical protein
MMAERQVVGRARAAGLEDRRRRKARALLLKPTPTTVLVLCYKHKKVDGRKPVIKNVQKGGGAVFTSDKLYPDKLPAWIAAYVKSTDGRSMRPRHNCSPITSAAISRPSRARWKSSASCARKAAR